MADIMCFFNKRTTLGKIAVGQIFKPMAHDEITCVKLNWAVKCKLPQTGDRVRYFNITYNEISFAASTTEIDIIGKA